MSVIHESLKKASATGAEKVSQVSFEPESSAAALKAIDARPRNGSGRPWLLPLIVFAVMLTVVSLIYAYEHDRRVQAEVKAANTLNELSDARSQISEITKQKEETEKTLNDQIGNLQTQTKNLLDEKESLVREKQALEFDNLNKEKRNSQLSSQAHRMQMDKLRLFGVVKKLRQKGLAPPA